MNSRQPDSLRTRLAIQAYLVGYQECTGPIASDPLGQRARRFTHQTLGDRPAGWRFRIVMNAYRNGWRDKASGKPCQPWRSCESEGA